MSTNTRTKQMGGSDFDGNDELEFPDVQDWLVDGGVETIKQRLDDFDWNGDAVITLLLDLSPDNRKVNSGKVMAMGELMKGTKDFRANRLFDGADKELRVSYIIEDFSTFTFNTGSLVGDVIDGEDLGVQWNVFKKGQRGDTEPIAEDDHDANNIGKLSIRPYIIPLSGSKAKLQLVVYPVSKEKLAVDHPNSNKAAFPGLELTSFEIDMFPLVNKDEGKAWGCPILPLIHLGGSEDDHPNLPPTKTLKAAISSIMRTAVKPDIKRDTRTLVPAWLAIQQSGPSKMKERRPDLCWPLWENQASGGGETYVVIVVTHNVRV